MKKLFTLLFIIALFGCSSPAQETYYKVLIHESNIDKIRDELSAQDGYDLLTWDKQEDNYLSRIRERIRQLPPAWECGFNYKEIKSDNKTNKYIFVYSITEGSYWKLNKESINSGLFSIEFDKSNIILGEKTLWIWMEKGEIKHSFNGIKSCEKKEIMILWKIIFHIEYSFVTIKDVIDCRGYSLSTIMKTTN